MHVEAIHEIQQRVAKVLLDKGLCNPRLSVILYPDGDDYVRVSCTSEDYTTKNLFSPPKEGSLYLRLQACIEFVNSYPSAEQRAMQEFLAAVGKAKEKGEAAGVNTAYLELLAGILSTTYGPLLSAPVEKMPTREYLVDDEIPF